MPRYFRQPKALWIADDVFTEAMVPSLTVCDHEATDTGLLDANGDAIYRAARPIGFGRDEEW